MDFIDEVFSGVSSQYVITLCLGRGTSYEKVYVYDYGLDLEALKHVARRLVSVHGREAVRLREVRFKTPEDKHELHEQAEWDREKLEDYDSDHGVDESGGYF